MSEQLKKVSEEDLSKLQELNQQFAGLHKQVGDLEVRKHQTLNAIDNLSSEFKTFEAELIKEYGDNVVINLESGEIKDKPEDGKDK
jgi:wobble nucleotide-excising tRNase